MGRKQLERPVKYCQYCGKKLEPKILPSGYLESIYWFSRRKYCNAVCQSKARIKEPQELAQKTLSGARRKANVVCPPSSCADCGKDCKTDVHHLDGNEFNNSPENLVRLCRSCHVARHTHRQSCIVCGKPAKGFQLCTRHYQQYRAWKTKGRAIPQKTVGILRRAKERGKKLPEELEKALIAQSCECGVDARGAVKYRL